MTMKVVRLNKQVTEEVAWSRLLIRSRALYFSVEGLQPIPTQLVAKFYPFGKWVSLGKSVATELSQPVYDHFGMQYIEDWESSLWKHIEDNNYCLDIKIQSTTILLVTCITSLNGTKQKPNLYSSVNNHWLKLSLSASCSY